jgi:hypothetical protein
MAININDTPATHSTLYDTLVVAFQSSLAPVDGDLRRRLRYTLLKDGSAVGVSRVINYEAGTEIQVDFENAIRRELQLFKPTNPGIWIWANAAGMRQQFSVKIEEIENNVATCSANPSIVSTQTSSSFYVSNSEVYDESTTRYGNLIKLTRLPETVWLPKGKFDFYTVAPNISSVTVTVKAYYVNQVLQTSTFQTNNITIDNVKVLYIAEDIFTPGTNEKLTHIEIVYGGIVVQTYRWYYCGEASIGIAYQSTWGGIAMLWMEDITNTVQASSKTFAVKSGVGVSFKSVEKTYYQIKHYKTFDYTHPDAYMKAEDLLNSNFIGIYEATGGTTLQQYLIYRHDFTEAVEDRGFDLHLSLRKLILAKQPVV